MLVTALGACLLWLLLGRLGAGGDGPPADPP